MNSYPSYISQNSYLETEKKHHLEEEAVVRQPPNFTKPLRDVEVAEGKNVHLEARLLPTGDSTMKLEWTVDGRPLKSGKSSILNFTDSVIKCQVISL